VAATLGPKDKLLEHKTDFFWEKEYPAVCFESDTMADYKPYYGGMNDLSPADASAAHVEYMRGGATDTSYTIHERLKEIFYEPWSKTIQDLAFTEENGAIEIEFPLYYNTNFVELQLQARCEKAAHLFAEAHPVAESKQCRPVHESYSAFVFGSNSDGHRQSKEGSDGRSSRIGSKEFSTTEGLSGISGANFCERMNDCIAAFHDTKQSDAVRLEYWLKVKFMVENVSYNMEEDDKQHIDPPKKDTGPLTLRRGKGSGGVAKGLRFLLDGFGSEKAAYTSESAILFFDNNGGNSNVMRRALDIPQVHNRFSKSNKTPGSDQAKKQPKGDNKRKVMHANTFSLVLP